MSRFDRKENSQNQLKLSQLRILVAIADHHSFSDAALHLEMSQSAVSHAIASLEDSLGVVLVSRGRHGAKLTPVGQRIVDHARIVVQHTAAIAEEAKLTRSLKGGQVRIASFRSIAIHVLPELIAQFHQKFPAIAISLTEHDKYADIDKALYEGEADVGFTFLPAGKNLDTWEILQDEYVAIFPKSFSPRGNFLTWEELTNYPLIMPPTNYVMMRCVYDHINAFGHWLNVAYEVETDASIVNLVAQGMGATILPRLAAKPIPPQLKVFSLPVPLWRVIGVAVVKDALHTPGTYGFLEMVRSYFEATKEYTEESNPD